MINVIDSSLENQSLRTSSANSYANFILESLKEGGTVSLESNEGKKFSMYKKSDFDFGVKFNSLGLNFENNPMRKEEALKILGDNLPVSEIFGEKFSNDLVLRLRDIFFQKNKDNQKYRDKFNKEDLFKNLNLNQIVSQLFYYQALLKIREDLNNQGLSEYLKNVCEYLKKQLLEYPKESELYKIINSKLNHIESYQKVFSDESFVEDIKQKQSDLETFIDILSDENIEGNKFPQKISEIKKDTQLQTDADTNAKAWFDKIYAWDRFAVPYAIDKYGLHKSFSDLSEVLGLSNGSKMINELGKAQIGFMETDNYNQKFKPFKIAHEKYVKGLELLLGTGLSDGTMNLEKINEIKNQISFEDFIKMPCSDVYPAIIQKVLIQLYAKDLYDETLKLLNIEKLENKLYIYVDKIENRGTIAKKINPQTEKLNGLKSIQEKLQLLRVKYESLENQIKNFPKSTEAAVNLSAEFSIHQEFAQKYPDMNKRFEIPQGYEFINFIMNNAVA